MKKVISLVVFVLLTAACSSPKYTYHFDQHDYNSGARAKLAQTAPPHQNEMPAPIAVEELSASTEVTPQTKSIQPQLKSVQTKINALSKEQRAELKRELKAELKKIAKNKNSIDRIDSSEKANEWDYDLKMAAIFGAIGVVLTALGGVNSVFWILGAIALVVGVIFLIKWLARQ